jgi:hypothetical protein
VVNAALAGKASTCYTSLSKITNQHGHVRSYTDIVDVAVSVYLDMVPFSMQIVIFYMPVSQKRQGLKFAPMWWHSKTKHR